MLHALAALAGTLTINSNTSDPAPRAAWEQVVAEFEQRHPEINVEFNVYDHESYKKAIRNWLTGGAPDVVFWYAGYRMRQFVEPGLLADVSHLFTPELKRSIPPSAIDLVTVEGRQYGMPYVYYNLGLYYRDDILKSAGISHPPYDWAGLLDTCIKLRQAGVVPIALGSKDLWPTAAWFDYLNLRLNGIEFHRDLMNGKVPYTDSRVRAVFDKWRELLDRKCFAENHASMSWQEAQVQMYQGRAAMMLIGSFIVPNFPPEVRDKMQFVPFPKIRADIGLFEDAPMNSLHIPARANNPRDAEKFLSFTARPDVQEKLAAALRLIPVNTQARVGDDRFLKAGQQLLASADQLMQYFDRDTSEDLATVAMKGFQEFMMRPERLDQVLSTIDRARTRIYR